LNFINFENFIYLQDIEIKANGTIGFESYGNFVLIKISKLG